MNKFKPVSVSSSAFLFCRYSLAILIWLSLILRSRELLFVVLLIFLLSVALRVKRSPMIWLYEHTINKILPSKDEMLNEHAMRFAHLMGAIFSLICLILLYIVGDMAGWIAVFCFAILKSISAFGYCPASKMYECATGGSCCAFLKKHD